MTIEAIDAGRTRMSIESRFPSTEAMEQVLAMGMEEGLTQAVGQIDAILAEHEELHDDHDDRADDAHPGRARCRPDLRRPARLIRPAPPRCCS